MYKTNTRFLNLVMGIVTKTGDRWIDIAQKCNINVNRFQDAVNNIYCKLTLDELYSLYNNYDVSYNELFESFNYPLEARILTKGEIYHINLNSSNQVAVIVGYLNSNIAVAPVVNIKNSILFNRNPLLIRLKNDNLDKKASILMKIETVNKDNIGNYVGLCRIDVISKIDRIIDSNYPSIQKYISKVSL